jgi:hypothetical protein
VVVSEALYGLHLRPLIEYGAGWGALTRLLSLVADELAGRFEKRTDCISK